MIVTLRILNDEVKEEVINVVVIERSDIRRPCDTYIRSVEMSDGWWELYNIDGVLCGYFDEDE